MVKINRLMVVLGLLRVESDRSGGGGGGNGKAFEDDNTRYDDEQARSGASR